VTTEYLKGLAIAVVLVSHYASFYAPGFYERWLFEYASEAVSVFFVLSGFGLYHSLRRQLEGVPPGATSRGRSLLVFYLKRALRIYPLYWLSLATIPLALPDYGYDSLHQLSLHTLGVYLAFPLVVAPGVFWFLPALMQCYLAAPFCYRLLTRLGLWRYLLLLAIATAAGFEGTKHVSGLAGRIGFDSLAILYRNFLLANILLLALGMAMPVMLERYRKELSSRACVVASLVLFFVSAYITRFPDLLFAASGLVFTPLMLWSAALFCLFSIAAGPPPFARAAALAGRHSYPLYLFHRSAYSLLALAGVITVNSRLSALATVSLMLLVLVVCWYLERASSSFTGRLEQLLGVQRTEPAGGVGMGRLQAQPQAGSVD